VSGVIISDKSSLDTKIKTIREGCKCCILFLSVNYMSEENVESAQSKQRKIGTEEENLETSGPAENLREDADEMADKNQDSEEPA
jgi:hypothetical protein